MRPVIVAVLIFAAVLGLRASGAFDPGPPKLDPNDARFNPAGQVVGVKQKDEGRGHVANDKTVSYGTTPPTSGDHWDTPAGWGSYDRQQPNERTVHNLEHGGIVIQFGSKISSGDLDRLMGYYDDDPNAVLMAPLPALGNKIAATAWQKLLTCTKFDKKALDSFKKKHRYKAPERLPKEALEPGR